MIKNISTDGRFIVATKQDSYGGIDLSFQPGYQIMEMLSWWEKWGPMFNNPNPSVQEALSHAVTLHIITKDKPVL